MAEQRRSPILFCCTHSTGEANTSIVLAGELARRGLPDLWFAADANLRDAVESLPGRSAVRFVSLGEVNHRLSLTALDERAYAEVMQPSRTGSVRARVRLGSDAGHHFARFRALDELVAELRPALMVINRFCKYAIQVAIFRRVPYVVTAPCLPSSLLEYDLPKDYPTPSSGLPLAMTRPQRIANWWFRTYTRLLVLDPVVFKYGVDFKKHSDELGLSLSTSMVRTQNENAELLLCFSVFGLDYPFAVPDNFRALGALVPDPGEDPRDHAAMRWLDGRTSVVYTAFGSVTRLTEDQVHAMLDVVRRLGDEHGVLWVLPEAQHRFLPAELPPNLRVEKWIHSQHSVLAHPSVRVVFSHGGSNSFHEGLYFGKPLLVRPICIDQYDHATRAQDSGVGLAVARPELMEADDVHAKLVRLLDEEAFGERARHYARVQREAGGVVEAGDLIVDRWSRS